MGKLNNIYRIDITATPTFPERHPTHGWQVRIRRRNRQYTKFFSDQRYGSREEAFAAAVRYRDGLLEELPDPTSSVEESAKARSKTGVVGLNFCKKDDGSGKRKPYVQLSWLTPEGHRKSASYSVEKWGLRRALWNACVRLHREKQEQQTDPVEMFRRAYGKIASQAGELYA